MERIVHDLVQGNAAWDEFRLNHFGASEIAAVLGLSKKTTRTELLRAKKTGIAKEFGSWLREHVLDRGHEIEALARPLAVEFAGVDGFYPVTASLGRISASCDGIDMLDETTWECKSLNAQNGAIVRAGDVPEEHMPQCQQVLMVTGAERLLFTVSDGTRDGTFHTWVEPDTAWFDRIRAAWAQFAKDLETYVPLVIKERPAAEVTLALPALVIHAKGEITTNNMSEYGDALTRRLAEVRVIALVTDQDFSNAKESAKLLRDNIQQAKHAKDAMLEQTVTVGEAARMIDAWCEDMRLTALKLEQDVEREDKAKKAAMVAKARGAYDEHVKVAEKSIAPCRIALPMPNFAEAQKNKRSYTSMQDAVDTALANAKVAVDAQGARITENLQHLNAEAAEFLALFPDVAALALKDPQDFAAQVQFRLAAQRAKDEQRAEAQRQRIAEEERVKAERKLRAEAEEQRRAEAAAAAAQQAAQAMQTAAAPPPAPMPVPAPTPAAVTPLRETFASAPPAAPAADAVPTLTLGTIKARLSPITFTAEGLAELGFPVALKERGTCFYFEEQFPDICEAIARHVRAVVDEHLALSHGELA